MYNPVEIGFELSQNFFDFLALEVKTYLEYLGITNPDTPAPVQNQFYGTGAFKTISWESYPNRPNSGSVSATYNYNLTVIGDNNPYSVLDLPRVVDVQRGNVGTTDAQVAEWENYLSSYRSWYTLGVRDTFTVPAQIHANTSNYSNAYLTDATGNISQWDVGSLYNSNFTAHKIDVGFVNGPPNWSYTEKNYYYIKNDTLYLSVLTNKDIFTTSDDVKIKLIDRNLGGSASSYTQNVFVTDKGDSISYYYKDGSLIFPATQYELSFNDYSRLFNEYSSDTNNTITFPTWDDLQGEYYIQKMHEYNFDLYMPDTSDYLDVSAISEPLSVCSDVFSYVWSNITALGFAPVLGFCLVATLIIKGLRGD